MNKFLNYNIGIIPLVIYVPTLLITLILLQNDLLPKDMFGAISIMMLCGFLLGEIGKRIPILKGIGGGAILATFLPSYLAYQDYIPKSAITTVSHFMESSNFLYVFISVIILGSILGMDRQLLIRAFIKLFIPLVVASVASIVVGIGVGAMFGINPYQTFFFIVVPVMAGGVGEGAIPLSMAYAEVLGASQEELFAQILPAVMLGSLSAIILAGGLKYLGKKKPEYSGDGALLKTGDDSLSHGMEEEKPLEFEQMGAAISAAAGFYLLGVYASSTIGIPGPIILLFAVSAVKALGWFPAKLEHGAYMVYRFFAVVVTYPLLFAVGVSMTPWENIVSVFQPAYLITIFLTVLTMVIVGFYAGKFLNMYPIEAAIVTACHSAQGGTGDLAILTAAGRMELMPFAQVSTRLGGAFMVAAATIFLRWIT